MFIKNHCSQNREVNRPIADSLWPLEVVPRDLGQEPRQVLPRSEWSWSPSWLSTSWLSTSWLSTSWSPSWLSPSSSLDIFGLPNIATKTISMMAHLKEEDDSLIASVVPLTDTHAVFHLRLDCHGFKRSFFLVSKS